VIMLYLHWGTEYQITPNEDQKEIAKKMCDLGVDVLIGGHPHVIQPVETIKSESTGNKMVCLYSCGNALSNQRISMMGLKTGHTEDGIMFYTTFKKYSNGEVRLEKVDYIPTWVNIAQIGQKKIHQIIPLKNIMNTTDNLGLNAETAKNAKSSYERTQKLVGSGVDAFNQSASQEQKPTQKDAA
ncbi:MAG: CapA family protein, partial [Oscillospiraceae bacterium]